MELIDNFSTKIWKAADITSQPNEEYQRYRIGSRKVEKDQVKYVVMNINDDKLPPTGVLLTGNRPGKDPLKGIVNVELKLADNKVVGIMTDDECVVHN